MRIVCNICLEDIARNEAVSLAVCGHVFDLTCIIHCLEVSKRCPLCKEDVFEGPRQEQFIRLYFSTDDADEKAARQLKYKINTLTEQIQGFQNLTDEHDVLVNEHKALQIELARARELISLIHEKYNQLKIDSSMTKLDIKKGGIK